MEDGTILVLSRKKNEKIILETASGDHIEIVVVEIRGDKCRLGLDAKSSVTIHREEVWNAIKREEQGDTDSAAAPIST